MRASKSKAKDYQAPQLLGKASELAEYTKTLSVKQLQKSMHLSPAMAEKTHKLLSDWNSKPAEQLPAIDAFLGDIYSGLQVQTFSKADRVFANKHLFILSGLYGVLHALDGVHPYRLEMGYKFAKEPYKNLYKFWGEAIVGCLPKSGLVVNLSSVEYTKTVLPYIDEKRVITPYFMTKSPKTGEPTFITVHAKVARGAFARWMIQNKIDTVPKLVEFKELGYKFNLKLSTIESPVFVCDTYQGLGLSVRLTK